MMIVHMFITAFCLCLLSLRHGESATLDEVKSLTSKMLKDYNKDIRPITAQNKAIDFSVLFNLMSIPEFDEELESLSTAMFIMLGWRDEKLRWNPLTENFIYHLKLKQSDIWIPDFTNVNSLDQIKAVGDGKRMVTITYDGNVTWVPGDIFKTKCQLKVTHYPFDIQRCGLQFATWSYFATEVAIVLPQKEIGLSVYEENGTWKVKGTSNELQVITDDETGITYNMIIANFELERRSKFYISSAILPPVALIVLSLFVFILPPQCGEKVSYAIAMFLAVAFYVTYIADALPTTGKSISIFVAYLICTLAAISLAMVFAVTSVGMVFKKDDSTIPAVIKILFNKLDQNKKATEPKKPDRHQSTSAQSLREKTDPKNTATQQENAAKKVTWKRVAHAFDMLSFVIAVVITIVLNVVIFSLLMQAS